MDWTLRISRSLLGRIVACAAESRDEVCGLLFGARIRIDDMRPCANVHPEPATNFEIDPAALIAAYRAERDGGPNILGCYHSHPAGNAGPSARDAHAAAPDSRVWLIVAGADVTAWRAVRDGAVHGRFDPLMLSVTTPCA